MPTTIKRVDGFVEKLSIAGDPNGPLTDCTFAAKDLFDIKGRVTGGGNPDWQRTHQAATKNSAAVQLLLDAGATLKGATVSDEFAFSIDGINVHYGAPINPQFEERVSGGSSSGSASAVGTGMVDIGLGTDTAGSVRVPASYCGIFGIRPTVGQISAQGVLPLSTTMDTVGWFARDAVTLKRAGDVLLSKKNEGTNAKRLLIAVDAFSLVSDAVSAYLEEPLKTIRNHFSDCEEIKLEQFDLAALPMHLDHVRAWETTRFYGDWMTKTSPDMAADIKSRFEASSKITKEQHDQSILYIDELRDKLNVLLGSDAVICLPTTADLPPKVEASADDLLKNRLRNLNLTSLASVARLPQISIPFRLKPGWKHGISLMGGSLTDWTLLTLAVAISA